MTEAEEQKEIVRWFRETYPKHRQSLRVSMGGVNFGYGNQAARKQRAMRSQGVINGEADIAILLPRNGFGALLIEHKSGKGSHKTTPAQLEYIEYHNTIGNCACITKGVDMAKKAIEQYMGQT